MIEALSSKATLALIEHSIINAEDKEVYEFGVFQTIVLTINIISTIIIAISMKMEIECLIFSICYISLRTYAGGYHCNSLTNCYLSSNLLTISVLTLLKKTYNLTIVIGIVLIVAILIIYYLAPIESTNNALTDQDQKNYRCKVLKIMTLQLLVLSICALSRIYTIPLIIAYAIIAISIMLLLGKFKNHKI